MGLITATFFECGVRYERTTEEGTTKKVNELYIVDALTFSEAESRITEEMQPFVSGDFDVMTLKRTRYSEYDNSEGDKYYKAKIMFITLDEKTGKEKRTAVYWLVPANDIGEARKKVVDAFANNPILKMYMTENAINKIVNSAKERIDAIHQSAIDKAHDDTNKFEDDAHYVANAYLEDTVDGWENVSEDQKNRSINALASFFNWMKAQADNE